MKFFLKLIIFTLFIIFKAFSFDAKIFVAPGSWLEMEQEQKDFYMKGALDAWGYFVWNSAPDTQRDLFISQYRTCIEKESSGFQKNLFLYGWEEGESAASDLYKWVNSTCTLLLEKKEFQNIKIQKNKPLESVTRNEWTQLSNTNKSFYVSGYIDGHLDITRTVINDSNAPKDMIKYYQEMSNEVFRCFTNKGLDNTIPFILSREINDSYPIPWNISFSLGAFCRD